MSRRRNSQVGFRDDTSYLSAHYGGRAQGSPGARASTSSRRRKHPSVLSSETTGVVPEPSSTSSSTQPTPRPGQHPTNTHDVPNGQRHSTAELRAGGREGAPKSGARKGGADRKTAKRGGDATRPTLSEQLASIGKGAEDITAGIRQAYGLKPLDGALLTTPSESFLVGKLRCKYPSPVHFFNHKCVYVFHHPFETTRITMEMFFRDMRCAVLDHPRRQLRFKIDHPLCHYGSDYSHDDPSHFVIVEFSSGLDADRVSHEIMPLIRLAGGVR